MNQKTPSPIRILHIFGRMTRGGAEMRTLEVMRQLDREKFQLSFCALSGLSGELDPVVRELGGEVFPLRLGPAFPWKFMHLLRSQQFRVVHSHVHLFSGFILFLAAMAGIPRRIAHFRSMHDGKRDNWRRRLQTPLMRYWIAKHATNILAVCRGAMESAWDCRWESDPRCRVVYNGIDHALFSGPSQKSAVLREFGFPIDGRLCIHIGRIVEAKNHDRLLRIFARVAASAPASRLLLVGRGGNGLEADLRSRVAQLGLQERVRFAGERSDVPRLLRAADLMIFPSKWEGLPGAVLEACAADLPVLASSLPGVEEIAPHFPGLLVPLSLAAPDLEWEETALRLLQGSGRRAAAATPPTPFLEGAFSLRQCAATLSGLWSEADGL